MGKYPQITAHMVVKNEDRFIRYAVSSVLPYVSAVLITDTGSTDQTVSIIKSFREDRIVFRQEKINAAAELADLRTQQIQQTRTDWFWIVDGDEVYPRSLGKEIVDRVQSQGNALEGIVVGRYDLLGDIYHYQSESVGAYNIFGRQGHWVLRLLHKSAIAGLHVSGTYPYEGYYDGKDIEVTHHDSKKYAFTNGRLWHAMYLQRSSKGATLSNTFHRSKWKIETGHAFPSSIRIPEVFSASKSQSIPDVCKKRPFQYETLAAIVTPMKMFKRKVQSIIQ